MERGFSIYADITLTQVPRILGFGDRNKDSSTYGCFDRYYWHYKLIDIPNARFQEAVLLLALLYKYDFPGNIYYQRANIKDWIQAGIDFWARSRNRDGSLNEIYPYERSFCATSFSTYAVTEAIIILKDNLSPPSLQKTGVWLSNNDNFEVSNQMAESALALHNIFLLTGKNEFQVAAREKVAWLVDNQDFEGFFPEYGDYDVGYLSLTLSCLARYYLKTGVENLVLPMKKAVRFLEERIRENGSFDIEGTSRRTQYIYPYGLRVLKSEAVRRHLLGLRENKIINPAWLDDRYVVPLAIDYLQTYLEKRDVDDPF